MLSSECTGEKFLFLVATYCVMDTYVRMSHCPQ